MKDELLRESFWHPGMYLLFDYRKTNFQGVKLDDLRQLAKKHAAENERFGGGKMALLMNSMRDYGVGRQYELLSEALVFSEIMVFRDEKKAIDWLNSPE